MATTTGKPAVPASHFRSERGGGRSGPSPGRPYSVREAAALLGVSQDAVEGNYRDLEGFRVGRRILIPRRVRLVRRRIVVELDRPDDPPVQARDQQDHVSIPDARQHLAAPVSFTLRDREGQHEPDTRTVVDAGVQQSPQPSFGPA